MLQILRNKAQSLVIQAIVVVIALVFIFWGVGTNLMNKQEAAIVVNDEEISFQQFQQAYDQAYTRLAEQFGGTVPKGLAESLNIRQQVVNQLTQEALLRQGGAAMGIMVSGQEIREEIEGMVQFQENGAFSLERYKAILGSNRMSPTQFEQSLRFDLLASKTIRNLSNFALSPSDYEVEDLYRLEKETVSVVFTTISPQTYQEQVEVDETEVKQWYEANGERYKTEPMIELTYLPFSFREVGSRVTIDETDIQNYYDQHLTEYQIPEKRHARHILLKAGAEDPPELHEKQRRQAEEIRQKAVQGEDFAALATQYSEGPTAPTGGDLGFFARGQMVKPFDDAVFALQEGAVSEIVKTDFGYHVIKLEEIQLAGVRTLAEVHDEIAAALQLDQAKPLAFQVANEAYENIIGAGSLNSYLEAHPETEVVTTAFFSRSNPPAGMVSDPAFLDRAFSLKQGELSSLVETAEGYAIISATAVKEPQVPDFAEVAEQATTDYKAEKAREKAEAIARQLIEDVSKEGASFEERATAAGLTVQESGGLTKNSPEQQSAFPPSLVTAAFRLSVSDPVVAEPALVGDTYYVFRFVERKPPETAISEEDRSRYREMLQQFKQQQMVEAWLQHEQADADISMNKSLQNF